MISSYHFDNPRILRVFFKQSRFAKHPATLAERQKSAYLTIVILHDLHVHFLFLHVSQPFSFFPRDKMTLLPLCERQQNFIFSCNMHTARTNLIPGELVHILQADLLGTVEKWLQRFEATFSGDVLVVVDVFFT